MTRVVAGVVALLTFACGSPRNPAGDGGVDDLDAAPPDADEGMGFRVKLDVIGVRDPMQVTLRDDTDQSTQSITITEDGTQRFPRRLPDQHAFTILLDNAQPCMPTSPTATIAGADVVTAITCDGVIDVHSIRVVNNTVPLRFLPRFDPQIDTYLEVCAPLLLDPGSTIELEASSLYAPVTVVPQQVTWPVTPPSTVGATATITHAPFGTHPYTMTLVRKLLEEGFGKSVAPIAAAHLGGISSTAERGITGNGIAISEDTVVAGDPGTFPSTGLGGAQVFRRHGVHWLPEARIGPPVGNANFGTAVAIDTETMVIGAPKDGAHGATYIYERTGTQWALVASLRPTLTSGEPNGALFGGAVAIAKPYLIVGASSQGASNNGAVYVFHDDGALGWNEVVRIDGVANARLGSAVALTTSRMALGAPGDGVNLVRMFELVGTTWTPDFDIVDPGGVANNFHFGEAVALSGNLVVIGAPFFNMPNPVPPPATINGAGIARVYRDGVGTWTLASSLFDPLPHLLGRHGFAVGISGHHVIIGSPRADRAGGPLNAGGVFYHRCDDLGVCPAVPEHVQHLSATSSNSQFGTSIAIDGLTIVVGAPDEGSIATTSGAAYIYR